MSIALTPATEQRLQRELETGNFREPDALLNHLLDLLEAERSNNTAVDKAMNDWLFRNRDAVNAALDQSFAQAERGEGYSPEESQAILDRHRAARIANAA